MVKLPGVIIIKLLLKFHLFLSACLGCISCRFYHSTSKWEFLVKLLVSLDQFSLTTPNQGNITNNTSIHRNTKNLHKSEDTYTKTLVQSVNIFQDLLIITFSNTVYVHLSTFSHFPLLREHCKILKSL